MSELGEYLMDLYDTANENTIFFIVGTAKHRNKQIKFLRDNIPLESAQNNINEVSKLKKQLEMEEFLSKQLPIWICCKTT